MLICIPLDQIDDNPFQERQDYTDVAELAGRIAAKLDDYPDTFGLMQVPRGRLVVTDTDTIVSSEDIQLFGKVGTLEKDICSGLFRIQLAFGHRRARAFRHLHQTAVPGYEGDVMPIHVDDLTDDQMLNAVWSENHERKDISDVERARLLARKLERVRAGGGSQRDVADEWGLARPTVANLLRLLELPEEIQDANQDGRLSQRQCLALAPVVQLQQALNGCDWSKLGNYWNQPKSPAEYIQAAVKTGDETSDDIREYARRALNYAGKPIPKCIAKHEFALTDVHQAACKGCPMRINGTCLDEKCLAVKESGWIEHIVGVVSEELDIPASDREADFVTYKHEYETRSALRTAFEQKLAGNLVVGWSANDGGLRPFYNSDYCSSPFDNDGRAGIIIGTRGVLLPDVLDQVAEITGEAVEVGDIPDRTTRDAWENEANKYLKAAGQAARQALVDELYASLDGDVIQALMCRPDDEWIDDHEKLVSEFVKFMWDKGRGMHMEFDAWPQVAAVERLLNRAGLNAANVLSTGSKEGDMRQRAVMALTYWYKNRRFAHNWNMEEKLDALTVVFAEFESAGPWANEEMANLHHELGRAMDDVEMKIEKEAESA